MMAAGLADDSIGHWLIAQFPDANKAEPRVPNKPPYRVPLLSEVNALESHGLTVVSTFAGCGGSSTGYRMAGFKVLLANEYDEHAQTCYMVNKRPWTKLERRDIRSVTAEDIMAATGLQPGELDVLDGSPPCQGFSTAGKRKVGDPRNTLFGDYARLLEGLKPKVFVAENVSGMVKGTMKGIFKEILALLKSKGYRVTCKLLDAQWLGVPQRRQRVIFVGVREDLCQEHGVGPVYPKPLPRNYSVREACPWIGRAVHDESGNWSEGNVTSQPAPCIRKGRAGTLHEETDPTDVVHDTGNFVRGLPIADSVCPTVPASPIDSTHFLVRGEAVSKDTKTSRRPPGEEVTIEGPVGFNGHAANSIDEPMQAVTAGRPVNVLTADLKLDASRLRACNGENVFGAVNPAEDDEPCPTVQTVPHDTPLRSQRRKFTIGELKRICSFPDDYELPGKYAQQWARLGNSVPPVMMFWIARTIRDEVLLPIAGKPPWTGDPPCLISQEAETPGVENVENNANQQG